MIKPKLVDIVYASGLFDGEGNIAISRHKGHQPQQSDTHHLYVKITNTNLDVLLWLREVFGGFIADHHNANDYPYHLPSWNWWLVSRKAKGFLELVKPYAKIKGKAIDIALDFANIKRVGGKRLTPHQVSERDEYRQKLIGIRPRAVLRK